MRLLHEELTYSIRGCVFDVHNALGRGHNEESYHLAMEERLKESNISFKSKEIRYVKHRGKKVHKFIADLIIEDEVVLELKNIQTDFTPINFLQIISYLKCWEKELVFEENYDLIKGFLDTNTRDYLLGLRTAILLILEIHGLGYGEPVYQAILEEELSHRGIPFSSPNLVPVKYNQQVIKQYEMNYPIIGNQIICGISAVKEDFSYDIAKIKAYLKALDLPIGIIAHFGKKQLEIIGIRP